MNSKQWLESLCALNGPSGFEYPVSQRAAELLRQVGLEEVSVDRMGNVLGVRRCGKPGAKKLLLDAHLDEIGLMVTGIEEGFLRFQTIGGVDPRMLPAREVTVLTEPPLFGVVACLPPHVQSAGDYDRAVAVEDLRIDLGLSQERAEALVPIGTPITYRNSCFDLANGRLCGKSMDDRACFTILLRTVELLAEQELDVDLYVLGSTREEVSMAGAQVSTYRVMPDFCVAVDVTHGTTPDSPKDLAFEVGGGPAIGIGPNMTRWMSRRLRRCCETLELEHAQEVMEGRSGTNAWAMQISREGIATAVVSLPLKYMHTPMEVLALEDLESTAKLLAAFTVDLGKEAESLC